MPTVQTLHILHITMYAMAFVILWCMCVFSYVIYVSGAEPFIPLYIFQNDCFLIGAKSYLVNTEK